MRVLFLGACAAALMFSSEAASARSGAAVAAPTAAPPTASSQVTPPAPGPGPAIRHHHPRGYRAYLPAAGAFAYGGDGGPAPQQIPEHTSADVRYTYTYDVPWDWAHRYPPNVVPSDRPYVSSCPMQTVTVPGRHGGDHSVTITRCY
ncbi:MULTISPECIES: hypothetical protein [Bradyrhizobium]|uniref:hypothetical protein n=2 Tax=Nitrobacteraceae TaxID=41294 RepID=UPI0003A6C54A|nr:hypothetical protein [Bradyrhizobium denitrificans]MCL8486782.1 hypothetical protein [Bradyrhizobium denitrificans]